ncbi:flavin reductase [Ruicaihuangia caeni]|uniref:flavin reductase n=1 Tax=Ruicaihuangia caeni TaxID=3042517 RepID=UPI00339037FA
MTWLGNSGDQVNSTDALTPEAFVSAMNVFASGVAVVTTRDRTADRGATVAAIAPIAADPPTVMISMSATSSTAAAAVAAGSLTLNVLDEDSAAVAGRFATGGEDKFSGLVVQRDQLGNALLPHRIASISCQIIEAVEFGSHWELRGRAIAAEVLEGHPLAYFRGAFAHVKTAAERDVLALTRALVLSLRTVEDEQLDPDQIAHELSVPRGAVLRALSALKSENIVERREGVYMIAAIPEGVVDAAYEARLAIEIGAATLSVGNVTAAQLRQLRDRHDRFTAIAVDGSYDRLDEYVAALDEFHEYLVGLAGSAPLVDAYRSLGLPGIDRRTITEAYFRQIAATTYSSTVVDGFDSADVGVVLRALQSESRKPRAIRAAAKRVRENSACAGRPFFEGAAR